MLRIATRASALARLQAERVGALLGVLLDEPVEYVLITTTGDRDAIAGYGLDLEITETGLLHDVEGASRKLRELRSAGMRVAIDDFGTGYSSLGLLSKLPVDLLKIDRSFISGLPADPALGHAHADVERHARRRALEPAGVGDLHLVLGAHGLPEARRRDHDVRTDLSQVLAHGGRLLGEAHGGARVQRDGDAQRHHGVSHSAG